LLPCAWKHKNGENSRNASSEIGTIATASTTRSTPYIGRFAPSPTGPLHFGSLLAAIASFLEARRLGGQWLVRVEDIDPPREQPGATDEILAALECHGFEWDGSVTFQSASRDAHEAAIVQLTDAGNAYRCGCSRRDLADAPRGALGIIYPGTCRDGCDADEFAIRVRTDNTPIEFDDRLQGRQSQALETESGDFIILRRDGLIAYQLAVVVDDELQGITDVVRGIDLMDSTPRQIWLQKLLGYATPTYCHVPVATNDRGQKLSKSHGAPGVRMDIAQTNLFVALEMLGQEPPTDLALASLAELWQWASENWDIDVLTGQTDIPPSANRLR
jgi:glutamyl-Q tRNA(Asp) synthetase